MHRWTIGVELVFLACCGWVGCSASHDAPAGADTVTDVNPGLEMVSTPDLPLDVTTETVRAFDPVMTLPPFPWWDNDGFLLDEAWMLDQAALWCHETGGNSGDEPFFFDWFPSRVVGALCESTSPGSAESPETLLSVMYLSGWYGGLWFRDHADLMSGSSPHGGGEVLPEAFLAIADNAAWLTALSRSGTAAEVEAHNREALTGPEGANPMDAMMDALLTLFAYNYGYVRAILSKPPAGAVGKGLPCRAYLDCAMNGTPLDVYSTYQAALAKLENPEGERWTEMVELLEDSRMWVDVGRSLWSKGGIDSSAWAILVDINATYLKITAAAVLASMLGYADSDEPAGRCAALLEAAVDTWNRSYFLALRSDAPAGTMPTVECRPSRHQR